MEPARRLGATASGMSGQRRRDRSTARRYPQVDASSAGTDAPTSRGRPARRHGGAGRTRRRTAGERGSSPLASGGAVGGGGAGDARRAPSHSVSSGRRSRPFSGTRRSNLQGASEVAVRRRLGAGPALPARRDAARAGGRRLPGPGSRRGLPLSVSRASSTGCSGRTAEILRAAGAHGEALGIPVAAVGGLVQDVLLGRVNERTDLDLVVEGARLAVAQAVAGDLGGRTVEHPRLSHGDRRPAGRRPGRLRDRAARVLPGGGRAARSRSGPRSRRTSGAGTSR